MALLFSSPGPKGGSELLPNQCAWRKFCIMHCPSTIENKYSNIFFYKTSGFTALKFHMEHNLTPVSRNCKIRSVGISKMAAVTKK